MGELKREFCIRVQANQRESGIDDGDERFMTVDKFTISSQRFKMADVKSLDEVDNNRVYFHIRQSGGGWMKTKKHLTKIEAMKMLKTRVVNNVVGALDEEITASIPEEIEQYITKVKGIIQNISLAKAQNIPIVKTGLKQASDTSLKVALDILISTSRKGLTEERIGKAISILLPSMVEVATSRCHWKTSQGFDGSRLGHRL